MKNREAQRKVRWNIKKCKKAFMSEKCEERENLDRKFNSFNLHKTQRIYWYRKEKTVLFHKRFELKPTQKDQKMGRIHGIFADGGSVIIDIE